jgi:DNA repair protein RadC
MNLPLRSPPTPPAVQAIHDRLALRGPDALGAGDLLAILLHPESAPRSRDLLERFGGLRHLAAAPAGELRARGGLADPLALRLAAAFALGREVHAARLAPGRPLRRSDEIADAFVARLRDLKKERFLAVLLDGRQRVLSERMVSEGTLTASLVHPREVFGPAIREAAAAVVLVHNHPSGDPEPSPEDLEITRRLVAVGELVGIRVLDHLVIGGGTWVSFLQRGLL